MCWIKLDQIGFKKSKLVHKIKNAAINIIIAGKITTILLYFPIKSIIPEPNSTIIKSHAKNKGRKKPKLESIFDTPSTPVTKSFEIPE